MTATGCAGKRQFRSSPEKNATDDYVLKLPWGAPTALEAGFFQEFLTTDPVAAIASSETPLLVIVGSKDTTVAPQPQMGELFTKYHSGPSELFIVDTDHSFGAFDGTEKLDEMIAKTLEWIGTLK